MKQFIKIQGKVERAATFIGIITLLLLMFLTVADVTGRYVFNWPIPGAYEISELMLIPIVFLGLAHIQDLRQHIRVDFLEKYFPKKMNWYLNLCSWFLGASFFLIMTWQSALQAWEAWITGDYYMGLLEVPLWPARTLLAIGLGLLTIRFALSFIQDLNTIKRTNI